MQDGGYLSQNLNRSPGRMAIVIALHGAAIAALMFAPAEKILRNPWKPLDIYNVEVKDPPPPEPLPKTKVEPRQQAERITTVTPTLPTDSTPDITFPTLPPLPFDPVGPIGDHDQTEVAKAPVMVDAELDPAFSGQFQPDYPSSLARQEIEGVVKVRVLIGTDGRVKAVEQISATDPLFFQATERKALRSWRFKPATRDGVPIESWRVMSVRFRLQS